MSKLQVFQEGDKFFAKTKTDHITTPGGVSDEYRYLYGRQVEVLRQAKHIVPYAVGYGNTANFVFFSDIHGDGINLERIVKFWKSLPYEIDCLCGGDMVQYVPGANAMNFWKNIPGTEDILTCVGNHDDMGAGAANCYQYYFAENIASWGVSYTPNLCYYYKDYTTQKLRLIVLDCMNWTTTQRDWLVSALSGARTAGYHVICMDHKIAGPGTEMRNCSFDTIGLSNVYLADSIDAQAPAAVQDFIDAGGKFVCWLAGHIHSDVFRVCTAYAKQLNIIVACACIVDHVSSAAGGQLARVENTKSQDLFDLISVNTDFSFVCVSRVGADYDNFGRHIGSVVYDYANHQILWND